MLPTIAISGRPNVGKSTLFNRLTRTRNALVCDIPGLTRDRQYGTALINGMATIVIDTGGINNTKTSMEKLMLEQTELALKEAQLVLFMVDAKTGLLASDENIARKLRKLNKPILVLVNKIDGQDVSNVTLDFHSLGLGECIAISAEHNIGFGELESAITTRLRDSTQTQTEEVLDTQINHELESTEDSTQITTAKCKVTFVGRPNVGKSTLVNRILGENRMLVYDQPGTTRDSVFTDFSRRGKEYVLVDTAGVRRRGKIHEKIEKFSIVKTLQAIEATNVVVFLVDATENITDQDLKLLGFVLEAGRSIVIAVNKWDNLETFQRTKIKSELSRRLKFLDFVKIHFISALHGTGVGNLFKSIDQAYLSANLEPKTSDLNKILESAINTHQPPMANGNQIKLRYAHAGHANPPTIIIHGTRLEHLPESYRRYLEHFFRKSLNLWGTPIQIIFKHGT